MTILYLSVSYVPSRRASSVQVMKMCEALARAGHEVTLVTKACPERQEPGVNDDYAFYGVAPTFSIMKLTRPSVRGGGILFLWHVGKELVKGRGSTDLIYTRDIVGAWIATVLGCRVLLELHDFPEGRLLQRLLGWTTRNPKSVRLVTNSKALLELLQQEQIISLGVERLAAPNGADVTIFAVQNDSEERYSEGAALRLGYVGNLYPGRGIELLLQLALLMPDAQFIIVGGTRKDLDHWQRQEVSPNVTFLGFVEPGQLKAYYKRIDVLLMPYQYRVQVASGETDTSRWMSPLKMFEYMAAGKPIVSSDLPVLREVLENERNALLVPPDDVQAWQAAIERLADDASLRTRLGQAARRDLENGYTWEARVRKVLHDLV